MIWLWCFFLSVSSCEWRIFCVFLHVRETVNLTNLKTVYYSRLYTLRWDGHFLWDLWVDFYFVFHIREKGMFSLQCLSSLWVHRRRRVSYVLSSFQSIDSSCRENRVHVKCPRFIGDENATKSHTVDRVDLVNFQDWKKKISSLRYAILLQNIHRNVWIKEICTTRYLLKQLTTTRQLALRNTHTHTQNHRNI